MDCPVCRKALVVIEREGIELDWCLSCRGLWFDEGELGLLAERTGRRLESEDVGGLPGGPAKAGGRKCPRCRRRMRPALVGSSEPVQIDRCADHGLWFDKGELGRVVSQLPTTADSDEAVIIRFLGETFAKPDHPAGGG